MRAKRDPSVALRSDGKTYWFKIGEASEQKLLVAIERFETIIGIRVAAELRVAVRCDGCDHSIPLNGPVSKVKCPKCQEILDLKSQIRWAEVLNYHNPSVDVFTATRGHQPGEGDCGAWDPVKLNTRRVWPSCPGCDREFPRKEVEVACVAGEPLICPDCGDHLTIEPAPSILTRPFPVTRWVVGAVAGEGGARPGEKGPTGGRPVVMACMSCGGILRVDGSSRLVTCELS